MAIKVLVPISEGFEEIEAMTIIDVLRRAGLEVIVAGLLDGIVKGRSDISVKPDCTLEEALLKKPFDMVILPGGLPNAYNLRDDQRIIDILVATVNAGNRVAAICAAPAALQKAGLLDGQKATNYPGVRADIPEECYVEEDVVESGQIITSRGPATAMEFSLSLVRILAGEKTAASVRSDVLA